MKRDYVRDKEFKQGLQFLEDTKKGHFNVDDKITFGYIERSIISRDEFCIEEQYIYSIN